MEIVYNIISHTGDVRSIITHSPTPLSRQEMFILWAKALVLVPHAGAIAVTSTKGGIIPKKFNYTRIE